MRTADKKHSQIQDVHFLILRCKHVYIIVKLSRCDTLQKIIRNLLELRLRESWRENKHAPWRFVQPLTFLARPVPIPAHQSDFWLKIEIGKLRRSFAHQLSKRMKLYAFAVVEFSWK